MNRDALARICAELGARVPAWVQGTGGNVSVKLPGPRGGTLAVKESGVRLDSVGPDRGLIDVPLAPLREALARISGDGPDALAAYEEAVAGAARGRSRPSMEAGFHALLPRPLVVHLHSLAAIAMAEEHARDPAGVAAFLDRHTAWRVAFVPPVVPGWPLARALAAFADADAVVLGGHGVVIQSDDAGRVTAWADVERDFCAAFGLPTLHALLDPAATPATAASMLAAPRPFRALFPDAAVFGRRVRRVVVRAPDPGAQGFVLAPGAFEADRDAAETWLAIAALLADRPALPALPEEVCATACGLPAEAYRRRVGAERTAGGTA
ncbi:MAG: class II aldolase/adducin family protein [Deltaproteobacteria bacterium]|nr:class II aldolase/adducin family protein [Deltaproteobacteria bacterium]